MENYKLRFSCIVFHLFLCTMLMTGKQLNGQTDTWTRISGVVQDSSGNKLPNVSISLRRLDSTIVNFASTLRDGTYELQISSTFSGFICATALGYRQRCESLIRTNPSGEFLVNFILIEEFRTIDEVNVEAKRSIQERGDTIVYRLDAFTNHTEIRLEDALAKLPGFRIDAQGTISVNGKNIRKIMLEGDDLTGENYKLISRNLSADMISEVEVFNRYLDNPLHEGIIDPDDVALNLKFRADRKGVLFGDAAIAAGIRSRYEGLVNGLVFSKMLKSYVLVKADNVGLEMIEPVIETTAPSILGTPFNPRSENRAVLSNGDMVMPSVSGRTRFNRGRLASLNLVSNIADKLVFKGNLYLGSDHIQSYSYARSQFFSGSDTLVYDELNEQSRKPVSMVSSAEVLYKVNRSTSMQLKYALKSGKTDEISHIALNDQSIEQIQDTHQTYHRAYLNYSNRINSTLLLEIQSVYMNNNLNQSFVVPDYVSEATINWFDQSLQQDYHNPFRSSATQAKIVYDWAGNAKLGFSLDYKLGQEHLNSSVIDYSARLAMADMSFQNDYRRTANQAVYAIQGIKSMGKFRLSANFGVNQDHINIEDLNNPLQDINQNDLYTNYDLQARLQISRRHNMTLSFLQNQSMPTLSTHYSGYIFSNYRIARNYTGEDYRTGNKIARLSYHYQFPFRHLFINAHIHYGTIDHLMSYHIMYDAQHLFQTGVALDRQMPSIGYRANVDKLFRKLNVMISLSSQLFKNRYINSVNSALTREVNQDLFINELAVHSTFQSPYSGVLSIRNVTNISQVIGQQSHHQGTSNWTLRLNNSLRLSEHVLLGQTAEYYRWKRLNTTTETDLILLDVFTEWELLRKRLTMTLSLRNVLNENKLAFVNMTDYSTNESRFDLQPFTALVGMKFRF